MAISPAGLMEGRSIRHRKYSSTVLYRQHQEERSAPDGRRSDAVPYIAHALEELVHYFPDGARILCVGPRDGYEMEMLQALGFEDLFGVDISIPSVRWFAGAGFRGAAMDMHEMALAPGSFDVILSRHNLEHAHTPELALREMLALLRPGGVLCVIVPKEDPENLGTHHGYAFSSLAELVGMLEANPEVRCVAQAERLLNNQWNPELWAVAVRGGCGPVPELKDRVFTQVWEPMEKVQGTRQGSPESVFTLYRKELRRRMQVLRPDVLEILGEPGVSPTVVLQMGEEAWRVSMDELPVWEREVSGSFDAVLAAGTLDASPNPFGFLRFLENIVSPRGVLAVVEPGLHPVRADSAEVSKGMSQGIRPTLAGLSACFPDLQCVGLESLGPDGTPFAVAGVWRKDGLAERLPEIDPSFRIGFPPVLLPGLEFFGKLRPHLEAFEADFLRRMGPVVRGDVLYLSPGQERFLLGGEDIRTVECVTEEEEFGNAIEGRYDTVVNLGGIGRSPDPVIAVEKLRDALRPGGVVIFGEACLAPRRDNETAPLFWRFTRPSLSEFFREFRHVRIESVGPPNAPLAHYGWARR